MSIIKIIDEKMIRNAPRIVIYFETNEIFTGRFLYNGGAWPADVLTNSA